MFLEFENPWQEVLTFLFESSKSDVPNLNLCSLRILNNFPGIFGEQEARYRLVVKEILWKAMDKKSDKVQQMAARRSSNASSIRRTDSRCSASRKKKAIDQKYLVIHFILDYREECRCSRGR